MNDTMSLQSLYFATLRTVNILYTLVLFESLWHKHCQNCFLSLHCYNSPQWAPLLREQHIYFQMLLLLDIHNSTLFPNLSFENILHRVRLARLQYVCIPFPLLKKELIKYVRLTVSWSFVLGFTVYVNLNSWNWNQFYSSFALKFEETPYYSINKTPFSLNL